MSQLHKETASYDLLSCRGCHEAPIDIGTFGRFKYVCPTDNRRDRAKVTDICDGGLRRPSFHNIFDAIHDWNECQGRACAAQKGIAMRFRLVIHDTTDANKYATDHRHEYLGNRDAIWFLWFTMTQNLGKKHIEVFNLQGTKIDMQKGISEMIDYNL